MNQTPPLEMFSVLPVPFSATRCPYSRLYNHFTIYIYCPDVLFTLGMDTDAQRAQHFAGMACGRIWTNTPAGWWPPAKPWNWVMAALRGLAAPAAWSRVTLAKGVEELQTAPLARPEPSGRMPSSDVGERSHWEFNDYRRCVRGC